MVAVQWIVQSAVIYSAPYMIRNIKFGMLYLLGACIFLSAIFIYCVIPEMKGLPLEQVHLLFDSCIWALTTRKSVEGRLAEASAVEAATKTKQTEGSKFPAMSVSGNEMA